MGYKRWNVDQSGFRPDRLWVAFDVESKKIIGTSISKERNKFVAERFISRLVKNHGHHPVSTEGVT